MNVNYFDTYIWTTI